MFIFSWGNHDSVYILWNRCKATQARQGRINHGAKRAMAQGPPP